MWLQKNISFLFSTAERVRNTNMYMYTCMYVWFYICIHFCKGLNIEQFFSLKKGKRGFVVVAWILIVYLRLLWENMMNEVWGKREYLWRKCWECGRGSLQVTRKWRTSTKRLRVGTFPESTPKSEDNFLKKWNDPLSWM